MVYKKVCVCHTCLFNHWIIPMKVPEWQGKQKYMSQKIFTAENNLSLRIFRGTSWQWMTPWSSGTNDDLQMPAGFYHKQGVLCCSTNYCIYHRGIEIAWCLMKALMWSDATKLQYKQNNDCALNGLGFGSKQRRGEKRCNADHTWVRLPLAWRQSDWKDLPGTGNTETAFSAWIILLTLVQCLNNLLKWDFRNVALSKAVRPARVMDTIINQPNSGIKVSDETLRSPLSKTVVRKN